VDISEVVTNPIKYKTSSTHQKENTLEYTGIESVTSPTLQPHNTTQNATSRFWANGFSDFVLKERHTTRPEPRKWPR
jgi:hypothetical protein